MAKRPLPPPKCPPFRPQTPRLPNRRRSDPDPRGGRLNRVEITGRLIERKTLRYTPAGVPVSEGVLRHASELVEAGAARQVDAEILLVALGESARWLQAAPLGGEVGITGFLAAKSRNSRTLALHVNSIEFLEGNENGPILQEEGR